MSFGKLASAFIEIVSVTHAKDSAGFSTSTDVPVTRVRAYREDRHGTVQWANRAAFSEATALFRFRAIPGVTVTTSHAILCAGQRWKILSVENVRGRGMYVECLCERLEGTANG
jgi:hypothetical protein